MRKIIFAIVGIMMLVFAPACTENHTTVPTVTPRITHTAPANITDQQFIAEVRSRMNSVLSPSDKKVITAGHAVCALMKRRAYDQMISALRSRGLTYGQIGYFVGAAASAYCPGQRQPFEQWLKGSQMPPKVNV